eukprot:CAMPEP_0170583264 /NCGR_PEP_ID=MMETSP0224-20130122/8034_1 /TAXON_ID=285029 /ORGANISM="Togula jolla, Strain CCCM 725" /LENGTH=357 /DNA_ID=CAMNT_0010906563 /DNA_START=39 /DNA_END=1112 /DNA_ORIENTATION=-
MATNGAKPVVMHLAGSAVSDYYEGVSIVYATQCMELAVAQGTYTNFVCRVHTNGKWSFPTDLSKEGLAAAEQVSLDQAVLKIKEMNPVAVVPHMFCLPGMTSYRAFCDVMQIPLVGNASDVMALSTNKWNSKAVVKSFGVNVPDAEFLCKGEVPKMQPPFLVKPCNEDNSLGISLVKEGEDVQKALDHAFQYDHQVLVERYIPLGRELRVAVVEQEDGSLEMLPCLEYFLSEVDPIRTSAHKLVTDKDGVPTAQAVGGRKCPADVDDVLAAKLKDMAVRSHKALGCRDYSLYDVRVDPQGEPYFIEACLYCSFSPKSVIVAMAEQKGQAQRTVYEMLVNRAIGRKAAPSGTKLGMKA